MHSFTDAINNAATIIGILFFPLATPFVIEHIADNWKKPEPIHTGARPDARHP